jgi:hypothetical protein
MSTPPRKNILDIPIIHHIEIVYKNIYKTSSLLTKRDKLGIHTKLLDIILKILENSIQAGLLPKNEKQNYIQKIRRDIEICKHLIRIESDLKIITQDFYIKTIQDLEKISIMANSWYKSLNT